MKKVLKYLDKILSDSGKNPSSKRIAGLLMIVSAIVLIACKVQSEHINTLIYTGAGLISLGIADNFLNKIKQ